MRKIVAFALTALAACVATPPPTDQVAAARAMVGQAQPAVLEAPRELEGAQQKLARAEDAMQRGRYDEARRLAEQTEVDARLALVTAENARAQRGAAEVERSVEALRAQLREQEQK
ncbi:MAG TPA: DUF4398 domain-containing protein [Burkholderiales bacterium]|nr:DUF4398 domain-containing protein [Burkholderiales bacterium]